MEDEYYPDYNDADFNRILNKYEFQEQDKRSFIYQDPRQLMLRNLISKNTIYDNILLYWQVGSGKCMKIDTPIIMYDGSIKKVQDILVGELLMGDDSTPRKVLTLASGIDKMYDIIPNKGNTYGVNQEHILCLKASDYPLFTNKQCNFNIKWIEDNKYHSKSFNYNYDNKEDVKQQAQLFYNNTKTHEQILEIAVKDYLKLPNSLRKILKGYRTSIDFSEKDLPFDPYIIGYWLGNRTSENLSITLEDSNILYYFNKKLKDYKLMLNKYLSGYEYDIVSQKEKSNIFLNTLSQFNLINNKHIPMIYKCNSRENRLKLLAGYIDANGKLNKTNVFEITQSINNETLTNDIMYLAHSLGFACYKNLKNTICIFNKLKTWEISIYGKGVDDIPTLTFNKKAIRNQHIENVLLTSIKTKYTGKDTYYGFTLDGNCRYILGDFTVTHNTCAAITIAEGFKEYVSNMGRKILVLVKNGNIEKNFKNELLSDCSSKEYLTVSQKEFLTLSSDKAAKKELKNKITRKINKVYNFMTYGTFVNKVLGMKEFEKDSYDKNTTKQKRKADGTLSRKRPVNVINNLNNTVIIIDEAHNVTNNDVYIALSKILQNSYNYRLVLLTATPMYDNPKEMIEISNLLNMNNPDKILPIRNDLFKPYNNGESIMVKQNSKNLSDGILKSGLTSISEKGKEILINNLRGKISYLQSNIDTFPDKIDMGKSLLSKTGSINVVYCYMSKYQNDIYQKALRLDSHEQIKIDPEILDAEDNTEEYVSLSKSSSLYKNSSDASTMTYPNGTFGKDGFLSVFNETKGTSEYKINSEFAEVLRLDGQLNNYSAKLSKLLENINKSPGNIFVYSNYVNFGGTSLIKQILLANGYTQFRSKDQSGKSFILYDDSTNVETREAQRKIFNSDDNKDGKYIKMIIGSPIISEGITLKNVRQVHILEPAWNMSRINQIIGRAVRHHSHDALSENQRNVQIYKYCSVYKTDKPMYFIDKEKYILAEEKDRSNKVVERLLKQIAFECNINTPLNSTKNNTAECDYADCKYDCLVKPPNKLIDKFTYNMYINFIEEFDIELVISLIKDMFKEYFIYSSSDIISKIKGVHSMISNESIYNSLKNLIDNKMILLDKYEREGFLIEKGDYIIFNPIDIDINSSIYSKTLDFTIDSNEYNLSEYVKNKFNQNIDIDSDVNDKKQKTKEIQEKIELSDEDIKFNKKALKNKIYGSYRKRATKESGGLFGLYDGKFRIIDNRNIKDDADDKRKSISGMAATSYNKKKLLDIIKHLEITNKEIQQYLGYPSDSINVKKLGIEQLVDIIEKHMNKKHIIIR